MPQSSLTKSVRSYLTTTLGSIIATDSLRSYSFINKGPYVHEKSNQSRARNYKNLYGVNLFTFLIKRLIRGTYQGRFEPKYFHNYLDEYVSRFNRRKSNSIGKKFMRMVQQVVKSVKITYKDISWDINPISEYYAT